MDLISLRNRVGRYIYQCRLVESLNRRAGHMLFQSIVIFLRQTFLQLVCASNKKTPKEKGGPTFSYI